MKLGIIREEKQPADKRVAFTPEQCRQLKEAYQGLELAVAT
jgi:alanine dehydrogenase